jgi:hypothetical protein
MKCMDRTLTGRELCRGRASSKGSCGKVLTIVVHRPIIVVHAPKTWHSRLWSASSEFRSRWSMADSNRRPPCLPGKGEHPFGHFKSAAARSDHRPLRAMAVHCLSGSLSAFLSTPTTPTNVGVRPGSCCQSRRATAALGQLRASSWANPWPTGSRISTFGSEWSRRAAVFDKDALNRASYVLRNPEPR